MWGWKASGLGREVSLEQMLINLFQEVSTLKDTCTVSTTYAGGLHAFINVLRDETGLAQVERSEEFICKRKRTLFSARLQILGFWSYGAWSENCEDLGCLNTFFLLSASQASLKSDTLFWKETFRNTLVFCNSRVSSLSLWTLESVYMDSPDLLMFRESCISIWKYIKHSTSEAASVFGCVLNTHCFC